MLELSFTWLINLQIYTTYVAGLGFTENFITLAFICFLHHSFLFLFIIIALFYSLSLSLSENYMLYAAVLSYLPVWPCSLNANGRIVFSWSLWKFIHMLIFFSLQMISSCCFLYAMRYLKLISFTVGESLTVSDNTTRLVPLKTLRHTLPLAGAYLLYMVCIS